MFDHHLTFEIPVPDGRELARYAVRLTHGTLEWIRPLDALGEIDRSLPMHKG